MVGEIRALLGRIPMLALTATATTATRTALISELGMQRCVEIVRSPDRPNIRLSVARIGSDLHHVFSPLINRLKTRQLSCERVLVYADVLTIVQRYSPYFTGSWVHMGTGASWVTTKS